MCVCVCVCVCVCEREKERERDVGWWGGGGGGREQIDFGNVAVQSYPGTKERERCGWGRVPVVFLHDCISGHQHVISQYLTGQGRSTFIRQP